MLWQLHNPNKTPGTGSTKRDRNSFVASTLTMTTSSTTGKRQAEDPADKAEKPTDEQAGAGTVIIRCLAARFVHVTSKIPDVLTPIT